jgi:hypothetical protein
MRADFQMSDFKRDMNNVIQYSIGFLDGAKAGKPAFLASLGAATSEVMKEFIDSIARTDPAMLQHMYEWEQNGLPAGRLYDINYTVSNLGLSMSATFRQSTSIKEGSKVPFYDKARIMEQGIPVVIRPQRAKVLAFNDNGEQVFTRQPVTVSNPGGNEAKGGFEKVFETFFTQYFTQSFIASSGILEYLKSPVVYSKNLPAGQRLGKSKGVQTGYRWIANVGVNR